jgi:DNA-3-methyladenine glycosylase
VGGRRLSGRLVEVEAYLGPEDLAAHSARGLTPRTATMYGPPGRAYVYFIYGMWNCLNFVTRPAGEPQAVLVRALEPGPGVGRCSGPGLLCRALEIDRSLNGVPLAPPDLYLVDDGYRPDRVLQAPRVGVDYSGEWRDHPWRFCLDSPYLSRPVPAAFRTV